MWYVHRMVRRTLSTFYHYCFYVTFHRIIDACWFWLISEILIVIQKNPKKPKPSEISTLHWISFLVNNKRNLNEYKLKKMSFIQHLQVRLCPKVCLTLRYILHILLYILVFFLWNQINKTQKALKRNYPNKSLSIYQNQCRARHYKFRFLLSPEISYVVDA